MVMFSRVKIDGLVVDMQEVGGDAVWTIAQRSNRQTFWK